MKAVKIIIVIIIIIVLLAIFLYLLSFNANGNSRTPKANEVRSIDQGKFPLRQGMVSDEILLLQQALNKKNAAGLVADGNFGPKTGAAVKKEFGTSEVSYEQFKTLLTYMSR